MSLYWPYFFADYYRLLEYTTVLVTIIILISSIDDLFIDAWFWTRKIKRFLTVERRYTPLTAEQLFDRPEQHIAIMVPAWMEYDVIAAMLENMVSVLDYRSYTIFAGTYQNDKATIAEVERMRVRYRQLVRVEVPHDGPTCKADCLNWVVQAIFRHEQETGIAFAGVVLHDSEDVLHPLELRFFNYLLPRKDLIQIPVSSLERNWFELVAGVYMDEFAEWHAKDLVVRESMTGMVPSAGVGTCFSRRALLTLAAETDNQPFNTQTLTEDYDIGVRLAVHGMKSIIARFPVQYRVKRASWFGYGKTREHIITMPLSVREYFPNTFRTSYRQKARWSLGICFQGWAQFGWQGSLADRYLLLRDRKGVVTAFISILAYILAAQFIMFMIAYQTGIWTAAYPPLIAFEGWLVVLAWASVVALLLRIIQRFYFTARTFGWEHGLLSLPRMIVGNFVNFMAVARAWKQYLVHLIFGTRLVWDKTMHDFPSGDGLVVNHKRLGELLIAWQAIDETKLADALDEQKQNDAPLGRILVSKGWLDEATLAEAIASQFGLERARVSEAAILAGAGRIPLDLCIRWRMLPLDEGENNRIAVGVAAPLGNLAQGQVFDALGYHPQQRIMCESEVATGLRLLVAMDSHSPHEEAVPGAHVPLLGDLMIEMGLARRAALEHAMESYAPHKHGLIGEFLVSEGVISAEALQKAINEQRRRIGQAVSEAAL